MDESGETAVKGEALMKHARFDALIIAARPQNYSINTTFSDTVMSTLRSSEGLSGHVRHKSVNKKQTLFMRFRHLPKLAVIAIAVGALLLVSGTAFAAYQLLWPKPEVQVSQPTTSVNGRQQVGISLEKCGSSTLASGYELKSNATITIDQVPSVVKAHCELDAIGTWADATFPQDKKFASFNNAKEYDSVRTNTSMATHIQSRDASSITFTGLTKYNQEDRTLPITSKTRFVSNGVEVTAKDITANDPVVYITSEVTHMTKNPDCTPTHCGYSGTQASTELLAVVKLSQPFEAYDQFAWQSLSEVERCLGNPQDVCLTGFVGGIDLFTGTAASADLNKGTTMKQIQGVVTKLDGTTTTIRSSSGTLFTLKTNTDFVSEYNTKRAQQYYKGLTVKVGSSLNISYVEQTNEHTRTLGPEHLQSVQLQTEIVGKSDPAKAY